MNWEYIFPHVTCAHEEEEAARSQPGAETPLYWEGSRDLMLGSWYQYLSKPGGSCNSWETQVTQLH